MKKIVCILLFIPVFMVNGQVLQKNSNWTEMVTNLLNESYCLISSSKLEGDMVINDLEYTNYKYCDSCEQANDNILVNTNSTWSIAKIMVA